MSIIAHSMGGLVAKRYIVNTQGQHVNKFISLGTPFLGTPKAFQEMMKGEDFLGFGVTAEILNTIPAAYELLPSKKYVNDYGRYAGEARRDTNGNWTGKNSWSFSKTEDFLKTNERVFKYFKTDLFDNALGFHEATDTSISDYVDHYNIIASGKWTLGYTYVEYYYEKK